MSEIVPQSSSPLDDLSGGKPGRPPGIQQFSGSGFFGGSVGGSSGNGGDRFSFQQSTPSSQLVVKRCSKCGGDGINRVLFVIKTDEPCTRCGGSGYC